MSSRINLVLAVAFVCLISAKTLAASSDSDKDTIRQKRINYVKINAYLEKEAGGSADLGTVMKKAKEWLETLERTNDSEYVDSLRLFVSLENLIDQQTCNSQGLEILRDNNQALAGLARYGLRAIDRVALEYYRRHADTCCSKYKENYDQIINKIDGNTLHRVSEFARLISQKALARNDFPMSYGARILEEVLESSPVNYIRLMDDKREHKRDTLEEARDLRDILAELSEQEQVTNDPESIKRLYSEYLEEPCQYYSNQIGLDLYEPVEMDEIVRLDSRGKVADCDDGPLSYRLGLAYYKICQMYILGKTRVPLESIASIV